MAVRRWLGDTLLNAGLVTRQQLDEALAVQNSTGQKLGQALVSLGYLSDNALLQTLCADAGIPYLNEAELQPQPDAVALIRPGMMPPLPPEARTLHGKALAWKLIKGMVPSLARLPKGCTFAPRCALATDECRAQSPPLEEYRPNHWVACWKAEQLLAGAAA